MELEREEHILENIEEENIAMVGEGNIEEENISRVEEENTEEGNIARVEEVGNIFVEHQRDIWAAGVSKFVENQGNTRVVEEPEGMSKFDLGRIAVDTVLHRRLVQRAGRDHKVLMELGVNIVVVDNQNLDKLGRHKLELQ